MILLLKCTLTRVNVNIKEISKDLILFSFFPEEKFLNNIIKVNCEKGLNKSFSNNSVFINIQEFFEHKVPLKDYYDIIIALQSNISVKGSETLHASYCNIIGDKTMLLKPGSNFELKVVYQELNVML